MDISRTTGTCSRDLRLDVLRGFACVSLVVAHIEAFSWFHMVFWERLGFVSGAEIFVLVSGYLMGTIHRKVLASPDGATKSTLKIWRRAGVLYISSCVATGIVIVLHRYSGLDLTALATFTDRVSGNIYPLLPPANSSWFSVIHDVLFLRVGPHQLQVLGLYMMLLTITPFVLMLLRREHTLPCLLFTSAIWVFYRFTRLPLSEAEFERGFPVMGWQIYFFLALMLGWHREAIFAWFAKHEKLRRIALVATCTTATAFLILAQATANPNFPTGTRLALVDEQTYRSLYAVLFDKNSVAPGRLFSAPAFVVSLYLFLGALPPKVMAAIAAILGRLGQASLYVFLSHVAFILMIDQLPGRFDGPVGYSPSTVWINTVMILAVLATLWTMIRFRFLFAIIPR